MSVDASSFKYLAEQIENIFPYEEMEEFSIAPSLLGSGLYNTQSRKGRAWHQFFEAVWIFEPDENWREHLTSDRVNKLYAVWKSAMESLSQDLQNFTADKEIERNVASYKILNHVDILSKVFPQDNPSLSDSRIECLYRLFQVYISQPLAPTSEEVRSMVTCASESWLILNLERHTGCALPRQPLKRWAQDIPLEESGERDLHTFCTALATKYTSKAKEHFTVREVIRALRLLARQLDLSTEEFARLLYRLEEKLGLLRCKIFHERDEAHRRWACKLCDPYQGIDEVVFDEQTLPLGPPFQAGPYRQASERLYIKIANDSSKILVVSTINEARLLIEQVSRRRQGLACLTSRTLSVDGLMALEEETSAQSVAEYSWDRLDDRYVERSLGMIRFLARLLACSGSSDPVMPSTLDPAKAHFSASGEIKFRQIEGAALFDFEKLRSFAEACAQQKEELYGLWMLNSGLANHPLSQFYFRVMELALYGHSNELLKEIGSMKQSAHPSKEQVCQKANELAYEVCKLRNAYYEEITSHWTFLVEKEAVKKDLSIKMMVEQKDKGVVAKVMRSNKTELFVALSSYLRGQLPSGQIAEIAGKIAEELFSQFSLAEAEKKSFAFQESFRASCEKQGIHSLGQVIHDVLPAVLQKMRQLHQSF